jgi:hypothetical protein
VKNALFFLVNTFHYPGTVQIAYIARLPTAGGVKGRSVEDDTRPATDPLGNVDYSCIENR